MQIQPINFLKTVSKFGDLSSTIAMVRYLRSAPLDTAWLVKIVAYFDLIS